MKLTVDGTRKMLVDDSLFIEGTWKLMNGSPCKGITETLSNAFYGKRVTRTGRVYFKGQRGLNHMKLMTVKGLNVLFGSGDGDADFRRLTYKEISGVVKVFDFIPPSDGWNVINSLRDVYVNHGWSIDRINAVWKALGVHLLVGNAIDACLKNVFDGRVSATLPVGAALFARCLFRELHIVPVASDVKVASQCTPLPRVGAKNYDNEDKDWPTTSRWGPHDECAKCDSGLEWPISATAIDLIGLDESANRLVLIEVKTFKGLQVDQETLRAYSVQAWLSWLMFLITYRQIPPSQVRMVIAVLLPTAGVVHLFNVSSPTINTYLSKHFKFLRGICTPKIRAYTHTAARPRVKGPFKMCQLYTDATITAPVVEGAHTFRRRTRLTPREREDERLVRDMRKRRGKVTGRRVLKIPVQYPITQDYVEAEYNLQSEGIE